MQVGDLVMYMGHTGIILEPVDTIETICQHWHVWFFDSGTYTIVYGPLMKKIEKIT
jgi:hypothetical protein